MVPVPAGSPAVVMEQKEPNEGTLDDAAGNLERNESVVSGTSI